MTNLSRDAIQAGRDYLDSPLTQTETGIMRDHGEALAIHAVLESERALRGNLKYIETNEGSNLPFRGLLQPLGVPDEHVEAMLADKESYPGLEFRGETNPKTGKLAEYRKPDTSSPEIIQKRLTATTLRKIVKDTTEIARIEAAVRNGGEYPLFSYFSPTAVHMYAKFMRKYTNNPRIRVFENKAESLKFLEALEGGTNGEKFDNTGIPMSGVFYSDGAEVVGEGEGTNWVSLAQYDEGFDARWIHRDSLDSDDYWITFNGSSPLLIEDKVPV